MLKRLMYGLYFNRYDRPNLNKVVYYKQSPIHVPKYRMAFRLF